MWTDISQFEIPENLKTAGYGSGHAGKYTDIGEVCVVNSMFGKARVRVIHPRKKRSLIWPLAAIAVAGAAVAYWQEQEMQKPPEPMRIIVRSVASEGSVQTNSETAQASPGMAGKAAAPAVPIKPQASPGPAAKAAITEKQETAKTAVPPVKKVPAPAAKPLNPVSQQTTPLPAGTAQSGSPAVTQTVMPPSANQSVQPVASKAAVPASLTEKTVIAPATEPMPGNNSMPEAPASSGTTQGTSQP